MSRNARRQMRFGDQKVTIDHRSQKRLIANHDDDAHGAHGDDADDNISQVILVKGHFYSDLPLCSRDEPVFIAHCSPLAMPENREIVVQVFLSQ